MKKIIFFILVSILCINLHATSTIKSSIIEDNLQENTSCSKGILSKKTSPLYIDESSNNTEIELKASLPEMSDSSWPEPSVTNYIFKVPDVNNKNYFSYKGQYILGLDNKLIQLLDSIINKNETYTLLQDAIFLRENNINNILSRFNTDYKKFQREKKVEATAYLLFPFLSILCFIFFIIYYEEDRLRNPLSLF